MQRSGNTASFTIRLACPALLACLSESVSASYQFEAVYTGEVLSLVSGGLETGSRYLDNLDLTLRIKPADAWGFGSGTVFVYGLYNNSATFSDPLVGDIQVASNIETEYAWRLFELWYEFGGEAWSMRTGLYDLNSEFDVIEAADLFLNSSHGIGPDFSQSGLNGPSIFPVSSLSVRGALQVGNVNYRIAVLDGVPGDPNDAASNAIRLRGRDGLLAVAEVEMTQTRVGRIWAGYWRYSADFEMPFSQGTTNSNDGWYIGIERNFTMGSRVAAWFVRYGQADERVNPLRDYLGAGVVINAPLERRPDDQIGLAVATPRLGVPYRKYIGQVATDSSNRETNWELTYRATISEHFTIQPNIQYVNNPSGSGSLQDAWIVGLRFEIAY